MGTITMTTLLLIQFCIFQNHSRVIVFTSNQEHHSNLLPWRELPNSEVRSIPDNFDGTINEKYLMQELLKVSLDNATSEENLFPVLITCKI